MVMPHWRDRKNL